MLIFALLHFCPVSCDLFQPNGRFQLHKKICLSISGHHPESWRPSWSIRTALLALIGFMPTHAAGALGSLEYPAEERRRLAKLYDENEAKQKEADDTDQTVHAMGDGIGRNECAQDSVDTAENLRPRRLQQQQQQEQSEAELSTGTGDVLESSSRTYSWELLGILLLSFLVLGLVMRRLFIVQGFNQMI
ncbi:unnamed protein product [Gongylonema pulchrum]|uniref:UBC core domain-containing protein n=1 Tax=Gongylonema pulchrum TaxID=637853 RepID=A0A183EHZ7_9BILA|nr:unnamed protein product [Gongylonema pulchrum]